MITSVTKCILFVVRKLEIKYEMFNIPDQTKTKYIIHVETNNLVVWHFLCKHFRYSKRHVCGTFIIC